MQAILLTNTANTKVGYDGRSSNRLFVGLQLAFLETVQAVSFSKVYLFVSLCCL